MKELPWRAGEPANAVDRTLLLELTLGRSAKLDLEDGVMNAREKTA